VKESGNFGNFKEISEKLQGNFREISVIDNNSERYIPDLGVKENGNFGNFKGISEKFQGNFREISLKFH
jgi:hypothetical protein